jgi:hypothetical protein
MQRRLAFPGGVRAGMAVLVIAMTLRTLPPDLPDDKFGTQSCRRNR